MRAVDMATIHQSVVADYPTRPPPPHPVRSRQIEHADLERVVDLLTRGFRARPRDYWQRALAKLSAHDTPPGMPKYGYMLESCGEVVGVILLIFSTTPGGDTPKIRCNVSSWYVEPAYRAHAALLIAQAIKHRHVTYLNVSPAKHTRSTIEAQGFTRYNGGQFVAIPALSRAAPGISATVVDIDRPPPASFDPAELALLRAHKRHGCLAVWCLSAEYAHPFVLLPRLVKGVIPCAQLVYCRDVTTFVRLARPLGRYLAERGRPFVIIDSNGPISGLPGKYVDGKAQKYFKGPDRPTFGDLAYTETVLFGP